LLQSGTYKIGAWFHSGRFADQRFDTAGQSLASPLSSRRPRSCGGMESNSGLGDDSAGLAR